MESTLQNNKIVNGVIWKQMLLFFFPIFLGTLFQQLYSMIDAVILGRFVGKEALAAVGGTNVEIISLIVNFFVGVASGTSVVTSQYFGGRQQTALRRAVYTSLVLALGMGLVLTVLGVLISPTMLRWINTPDDIFGLANDYMRYYFLGMIPSMVYNVGSGIFRAVGDARRPLYFLAICCVLNIGLDLLLVVVIPLGTAGAAIATSIAQVICALLVVVSLLRSRTDYRLVLQRAQFSGSQMAQMLRIGLPAGLQTSMFSIANVIIQSTINNLGTDSIAAWAAFRKVDSVFWPVCSALGITVMTFVGQNFGARRYDRMKTTVRWGLLYHIMICILFSTIMVAFRHTFIGIFSDDPAVCRIGAQLTMYFAPYYLLYVGIETLSSAMRGVGDSFKPTVLMLLGICLLRLAYLWLVVGDHPTNASIAFSYPMTWTVTSILFIIYYLRGNWLRNHMPPSL